MRASVRGVTILGRLKALEIVEGLRSRSLARSLRVIGAGTKADGRELWCGGRVFTPLMGDNKLKTSITILTY
jgi:hypothetical protein